MKCENCPNEHDGSYGSGRFCSLNCSRSFSTKAKRKEINEAVSLKLSKPLHVIICKECREIFKSKLRKREFCSKKCAKKNSGGWNNHDKVNWSEIHKKAYKEGRNYVGGGTTKWYQYKNIKVQGTYELNTCQILDNWKNNNKIVNWEYTNDRIEYIGLDHKLHSYLLDFKIFETKKKWYYLEIKGYKKEKDDLKWQAVKDKGFNLIVWYKNDIEKEYQKLNAVVV